MAKNVLHPLDETLKKLSSEARDRHLNKELKVSSLLAAEARRHVAAVFGTDKGVFQLGDGSLALVDADAAPADVETQVAKDPSAAVLGNQLAADAPTA